jgi:uncharacterized membrane protein HdeD (DUF308 family)
MPYPEDQTSSQSPHHNPTQVRRHAGDLRRAIRGMNGSSGGKTRPSRGPDAILQWVGRYAWVEMLAGVLWLAISVVVLKFNHASVTTVGILTGIMFLVFAAEEFVLAILDRRARWMWAIFGVLLTASGIVALIHPRNTFAGFADILGFVFLLIGVLWMVQAFAERPINRLWWLTLISGLLMVVLAFWVSGQFFLTRAYTLLIFAGVWAMTTGIIHIVRGFEIRELARKLR